MRGPCRASGSVSTGAVGATLAQWAAGAAVALAVLPMLAGLLRGGLPATRTVWTAPVGSAAQLIVFAAIVFAVVRGRAGVARRLSIVGVLLPLLTTAISVLRHAAFARVGSGTADVLAWWLPTGQGAGVHVLLGLAVFATLRPGRVLGLVRAVGIVAAVVGPAVSLSIFAIGRERHALIPGLVPMSVPVAVATMVMTVGVIAIALQRWPVRTLTQRPSDRVLVGHLLPLVVLIPVLAPVLLILSRSLGADGVLQAVLTTVVPTLALFVLLAVAVRDHRRLTATIESTDSQLLTILDGLPIAVMLRAQDGTLLHRNPRAEDFVARMGVELSDVSGSPSGLLDHVEVTDERGRPYTAGNLPVVAAVREGRSKDATLGFALPAGGHAWYSVRAAPVPLSDGTTGTVVTLDDVTEQYAARQRVAVAERSLRLTVENAPIGIAVIAPDGRLLQVNAALCDLLGYENETRLLAECADGLEGLIHPDEQVDYAQLLAAGIAEPNQRFRGDRRLRHTAGHWIHTELSVALIRDEQSTPLHLIAQVVDLSERRALEQELRAAATQDPLTGLINRRALIERLTEAQRRQHRHGGDIGLLFVDLDHFKTINDTYGHEAGDRLLIETGRQMLAATRQTDTVCRLGGDEFVVLCPSIDGRPGLQDLIGRLESMRAETMAGNAVVSVTQSIGSVLVEPGEELDAALRRADADMRRNKRQRNPGEHAMHQGRQVDQESRAR